MPENRFKADYQRPPALGEPMMKIDGACHCGRISFSAEIDPARVMICHYRFYERAGFAMEVESAKEFELGGAEITEARPCR